VGAELGVEEVRCHRCRLRDEPPIQRQRCAAPVGLLGEHCRRQLAVVTREHQPIATTLGYRNDSGQLCALRYLFPPESIEFLIDCSIGLLTEHFTTTR
jgi:hypothetical protein